MRRPAGTSRRTRRYWYVGAVVVLYVLLVTFAPPRSSLPADAGAAVESGRDAHLERVVSSLIGPKPEVWCWSRADWRKTTTKLTREYHARGQTGRSPYGPWSAFATPSHRQIHLSPEVCDELRQLSDDRVPLSDYELPDAPAWAVAALAHEAYHVLGVTDEAVAECYGMQSIVRTARLLGRPDAEGRELTRRYLKRWRPGLPESYRSDECRSNGTLDLDRTRASWP